jgi:hypothetical protein
MELIRADSESSRNKKCCLTSAVIFRKVLLDSMSIRGTVGSLLESHRAKATRPDRRIFIPQTRWLPSAAPFSGRLPASTTTQQSGQSDAKKATGVKATAAAAYEHILTIQNAADLEFPGHPAKRDQRPRPRRIPVGPLPAGSSRRGRHAGADGSHNVTGEMKAVK